MKNLKIISSLLLVLGLIGCKSTPIEPRTETFSLNSADKTFTFQKLDGYASETTTPKLVMSAMSEFLMEHSGYGKCKRVSCSQSGRDKGAPDFNWGVRTEDTGNEIKLKYITTQKYATSFGKTVSTVVFPYKLVETDDKISVTLSVPKSAYIEPQRGVFTEIDPLLATEKLPTYLKAIFGDKVPSYSKWVSAEKEFVVDFPADSVQANLKGKYEYFDFYEEEDGITKMKSYSYKIREMENADARVSLKLAKYRNDKTKATVEGRHEVTIKGDGTTTYDDGEYLNTLLTNIEKTAKS